MNRRPPPPNIGFERTPASAARADSSRLGHPTVSCAPSTSPPAPFKPVTLCGEGDAARPEGDSAVPIVSEIYASGPGLVFATRSAFLDLEGLVASPTAAGEASGALFRAARLFTLGTGSPGVDYEIRVYPEGLPREISLAQIADVSIRFEPRGSMVVADGYWLDYLSDDYDRAEIPVPTGVAGVRVGWTRATRHATMVLHVEFLAASSDVGEIRNGGWYALEFEPA